MPVVPLRLALTVALRRHSTPSKRGDESRRARLLRARAARRETLATERPSWLRRVAFALVLLAQVAGIALGVTEGRDGVGAGTHIEAVGTKAHYSHDETTCGACQLRSMHGRVAAATRLAAGDDLRPTEHGAPASRPPIVEPASSNHSRAPPTVI